MKICFFGTRMDLFSGHSRPAFELASGLIDRGHEVRMISTALTPERMEQHQSAMARSPHLARIRMDRPFADLQEMVRRRPRSVSILQEILRDCDVLHGFSFKAASVLNMLLPVRMPGVLSVSTDIHPRLRDFIRVLHKDLSYLKDPGFASGMLTPALLVNRSLGRFDRIICWSRFVHGRLRSLGVPEARIVTIPPAIDWARFNQIDRQNIHGSPVFIYAGLVSTLRGVPTMIQAFREVVRARPRARLIVADRGPHTPADIRMHTREQRRLERMIAEAGLEDPILLRRFEENLSSWFNACDALVLPFSTTIGYAHPPLTMLEAMAHGLPVISTRIGSVPEYVQDGVSGILTHPGDHAGMARAMLSLDPEAARRMGQNARKRIGDIRDWNDIAGMTEAVYADVLRSGDRASRL